VQAQRASLVQEQRLKMNPLFYQSLKLMELPLIDLRDKIGEELEKNPALEVLEDPSVISLDESVKPPKEDDYFEATSDSGFVRRGNDEEADEQHRFIEGVLTRPETLQQHLLWQLRLDPLDEDLKHICEILIQNLDTDGFHKEPVEFLFKQGPDFPVVPPPRLNEALALVQSLDPRGTCTGDYRESLRVQALQYPDPPDGLLEALDCLELIEKEKFAEAAKKLRRTEEEVRELVKWIKDLSPFPGRQFASAAGTRFVIPDIQVIRKEGEFVIVLNNEEIPVLGINPFFMRLSEKDNDNRQTRDFVRENIREARWFIQTIHQRNHTLLRVSRAIVEFQRSFFANGPKYLAPLTLRDIAKELGVHETTVSRTANGKYMQTEWGIFEIRHFFSNSISGAGSGGSRYSKEGVKEIIREMINIGDRRISDLDITGLLAKRGITLARRTVAKYRKELDLGSSFTR
jgi:RNA polymerase sigma-54 factor